MANDYSNFSHEELIKYIKQKVYEKFGKEIETEIEIIH